MTAIEDFLKLFLCIKPPLGWIHLLFSVQQEEWASGSRWRLITKPKIFIGSLGKVQEMKEGRDKKKEGVKKGR